MKTLTEDMKNFISTHLAYIATVSKEGNPNIGPKRSCHVYDDNTLIYNENTQGQHLKNILDNGKIAVVFADLEQLKGFRFVGKAEVFSEGKYFDQAVEWSTGKMPGPKSVVVIHIEEIYNMNSGAEAGTKIS